MIVPMRPEYAVEIAGWSYEGAYSVYGFRGSREDMEELTNGDYRACLDSDGSLTGYLCFGASARIPTLEEGVYDPFMLDMGLGMKPLLCGRGLGPSFVEAALDYARDSLHAGQMRLTVAAWNARAIRVYVKAGFRPSATVTHFVTRQAFLIMTLLEWQSPRSTAT